MKSQRLDNRRIKKLAKTILLTVIVWYALWFGLSALLQTANPIVFVGLDPGLSWNECSMTPTLSPGDVLFLQGVPSDQIEVGDIIVFRNPRNPDDLIVHRVVQIVIRDGRHYFTTKGDNPRTNPWSLSYERDFSATYIVGRVIFKIPLVGWVWIAVKTPVGTAVLIGCIIVIAALELKGKETETYT
jgi:signal peptidase I